MRRMVILCAWIALSAAALGTVGAQAALSFKLPGDRRRAGDRQREKRSVGVPRRVAIRGGCRRRADRRQAAFSRQYTTLALFDFTFQETNVIDHLSGAKIEGLSLVVNELYSDLNFGDTSSCVWASKG